ncbi:serine/threonine-protein kinase [Streptomyces aidingensis]|uniref:non-specific serine/threonine protein kinase n=1 Tax=Streptomyces aidingensis TaxID=910347 RepID=A0A1I1PEC9_9ACTN|nr:serine/threonine-protein kinase [Streptomyces aidingensis]SFD08169.1 Serine/threonine protein kinase [Streptomyces aidingensis]
MAENTTLIHGRYELIEQIGRGGMGQVWRARDEALGRQVAVKCLQPLGGAQRDEDALRGLRERFRREARVAASLQHRGITVVHDFGEYDGTLYLVMELLDGQNLSELLTARQAAPLPEPEIADIAHQVAAALAYTHAQGVVHRDLKPANVMRLADGTVKILDFGIARLAHDIGLNAKLTSTGMAMGTPHYMSPEQISGGAVDHRSDLYSLGCVLYELATGAPPFDLGDPWAILVGHRETPPEPLRSLRAELSPSLERLILELLAKDPADRPRDAADRARRLVLDSARAETAAPAAGRSGQPAEHVRPEPLPPWTRGMRPGGRASGTWSLREPSPDRSAGLTGQWTAPALPPAAASSSGAAPGAPGSIGRPAGGGPPPVPAPPPPTSPPALPAPRGGPSPEYLAALAGRHRAGIGQGLLGHWEEALRVHGAVAAERDRALGSEHPDTLASHYEAAYALGRLGRWDQALPAHQRVAEARARTLGPRHPDTLVSRYETAVGLSRLGRPAEAMEVYRELVAARTHTQGRSHPETLRARHGLGVSLGRLGRWEEALAEARAVCALRSGTLGPDDPDTLVSRREIAVALGWLGRWDQALEEYRRVRLSRERVLGPEHPQTLASRKDEAHCLEQLGRAAEAAELARGTAVLPEGAAGGG